MANLLQYEKSPYLLQHQDNPVAWQPWSEAAFRQARIEDKPIFLSIGYSTCHWCHVMAHESFEDSEVAAILNQNFICIKVDREERPDIDAVYMTVCQAMTGSGGWPLTVFLTPEQKPFFAGTYFPKYRRYGQPGLVELLKQILHLWLNSREKLLETGDEITAWLQTEVKNEQKKTEEPVKTLLEQTAQSLAGLYDKIWGGFGPAPKFPTPHNLLFLMRYAKEEKQPEMEEMALHTLRAMAQGGIHDQIGGGFSRYSTDERWMVPHFEKMLYDNALLILAYLQAWHDTGEEQFCEVVRGTIDYVLRELADESGGFFCGQDADSDGVEGKYYVFTPEEIIRVLGVEDGTAFQQQYNISSEGNFEGKSIPNCIGIAYPQWKRDDWRLKKLYQYRLARTSLHTDDKVLCSWNSWMILALARAGFYLDEPYYIEAAKKAQRFVETSMTDENNRLFVRWRLGDAAYTGQLDDYAVYALALLELYHITLDVRYLEQAVLRAEQMQKFFEDEREGGYYLTAEDAETLIIRPKETYDGAMPSGNSVAAMLLQKLAFLTGESRWTEAAHRQLSFLASEAARYPAGHCYAMLALAETIYSHQELVVCTADSRIDTLQRYQKAHMGEGLTVVLKTAENCTVLEQCMPFMAEYPLPEQGTRYYLCENGVCNAPQEELPNK